MHTLEAKIRTETARETRENGSVPAVVYGKDVPSTSVKVGTSEFIRLYREVGQSHVFTLNVEKKSYPVLIQELQKHPVTGKPLHIDFLTVDMKAEVHVHIPVTLVGTSPAVIEGGQIHQSLESIEVKCLPKDIVDAFEVDISALDHMGKTLHISDVKIDAKKFQVLSHAEEAVVTVHAPKKQKEETEATSVADVGVATAKEEKAE
ncbi:MAG: 50S ribosomal protein L25 [Candidatus Gracilibacteria bacterium]|nr:50S ribosomal protein L25 [Candidatus Gracilibacteria bacterium]